MAHPRDPENAAFAKYADHGDRGDGHQAMISESELVQLRQFPNSRVMPLMYYRYLFAEILGKSVSSAEASDAIDRLNGPAKPGHRWSDLTRSDRLARTWQGRR